MQFQETIRTHRERAGWTKKRLAELVGVTQPYIVQIENDGKVPSDSVVSRLADCLGIERRKLLFAAYRARAPKDLKDCFASILDDIAIDGDGAQPFIQSRRHHVESPDFVIRDFGTAVGGSFQVSLVETKTESAALARHRHAIPVTLIVVEGRFDVDIDGEHHLLSREEGPLSLTIPAGVPHAINALEMGQLITVGLGVFGNGVGKDKHLRAPQTCGH